MDWKKFGKTLLFPPIWIMIVLTVISTAALVTVFVKGWEETVLAYASYAVAFYTLSVVVIFCSLVLPKRYRQIKQKVYDNPLGNRYLTDRAFRTKISLYFSLSVNLAYVGLNIWSWFWSNSWWFVVLAVYYGIMAVMRFLLVWYYRKHQIGNNMAAEWKRARICACILLLINLSLSGAVLMILYNHKGYDYPGVMIYIMALYSFYAVIHSAVELIRHQKRSSPILSTAKIVSLSGALVSMLNLETAMFAQFGGEMTIENQQLMIMLTGAGVSLVIVFLSIMLIVRANRALTKRK